MTVDWNALHVSLIDKGDQPLTAFLHLPPAGSATVQRLLAPFPASRAGVTLDGQQLDAAGDWRGAPAAETLAPGPHG